MDTYDVLREAKRTLVSANERFGYQGDEEDQAYDLLAHAGGGELEDEDLVPTVVRRRFERMVERRATGEPMAYILGWTDFCDFRLSISAGAFVPRLTSEFLATQAIRRLRGRRWPVHVDLATGIGPVAIASARSVPHASIYGLDISKKALTLARANATKLSAGNAKFILSDMFTSLPAKLKETVDVVTIHPPYVARNELADLPHEIKAFEPESTLTDGSVDGLGLVSRAIEEGRDWIKPGGWLLIEITPNESRKVRSMMREAGYTGIRSTVGPMRYTRVIVARV